MVDTLQQYGQSFQTKILSLLVSDLEFLSSLRDVIKPSFFESDINRWIVEVILDYHLQRRRTPTLDVFKSELNKSIDDTGIKNRIVEQLRKIFEGIESEDRDYVRDEFLNFCINSNLKDAILKSADLLRAGKYEDIKDIIDKSLKVGLDTGIGHDYVADFEARNSKEMREPIATPWDSINDLTGGGLAPGELGVVVAPSGIGKSWLLMAIGAGAIRAGRTVAYYSLELSEFYVGTRYDTIFTGIPSDNLQSSGDEVLSKIRKLKGRLIIKDLPGAGTKVSHIESHIDKLSALGVKPDLIIVDYGDLMDPSGTSSDSTYISQGNVFLELRAMAKRLSVPLWTASQAGRSAIESETIDADKIADSYAKIFHSDFVMSLSRKPGDKVNNTGRIFVIKNRMGPDGVTLPCKMDTNVGLLEIYSASTPAATDSIVKANSEEADKMTRKLLHKKYIESFG